MSPLSRQLAGLIGPSLAVISITEALNMDMFVLQTAPVVYLNGTVLFVAGLAIVRAHNQWRLSWPVLVTLCGWSALLLGLYRMISPTGPQAQNSPGTYALLAGMLLVGIILSAAAYLPKLARTQSGP